jgi:hypothetical protein
MTAPQQEPKTIGINKQIVFTVPVGTNKLKIQYTDSFSVVRSQYLYFKDIGNISATADGYVVIETIGNSKPSGFNWLYIKTIAAVAPTSAQDAADKLTAIVI